MITINNCIEAALRYLTVFTGSIAVPALLWLLPKSNIFDTFFIGDYIDLLLIGVPLAASLPLWCILVYEAVIFHPALPERGERFAFHPEFLIGIALMAASVLTLPIGMLNPAVPQVLEAIDRPLPPIVVRLILLILLAAAAVFACMLAAAHREAADETEPFGSLGFFGKSIFWSLLFLLGGIVLLLFLPIIDKLVPIAIEVLHMRFVRIIVCILLAFMAYSYIRALIKRQQCLTRLYALCTGMHKRCERVKEPYLSVFFPFRSKPFELTLDGERFACKLVSCRRAYTRMLVREDGTLCYLFTLRIRNLPLFEFKLPIRAGFESKHRKFLVLNPSPNIVYVEQNKIRHIIDNGQRIGSYTICNTTAFLNAIERGCLGK